LPAASDTEVTPRVCRAQIGIAFIAGMETTGAPQSAPAA